MNNEIRKAALAFLAERYPGAYTLGAITQRINRSGILDKDATTEEVFAALRVLVSKFEWADLIVEADGDQHWGATLQGVRQWMLDGSPHAGG